MDEKTRKFLIDIQESIAHIEEFTENVGSFFDYQNDLMLKRAVERELERKRS